MENTEELETDIIDKAFEGLLNEFESEDTDLEVVADAIMDVVMDLVDEGLIVEIPDEEDDEEIKQSWIEASIPLIRERLTEDDDGDSDLE